MRVVIVVTSGGVADRNATTMKVENKTKYTRKKIITVGNDHYTMIKEKRIMKVIVSNP